MTLLLALLLPAQAATVEIELEVEDGALSRAQVESILRQANNPNRRIFDQSSQLIVWLSPQLTSVEQTRLRAFLAENEPAAPRS